MQWMLDALLVYLAASYGLLVYLVIRVLLGRPMRVMVGPQSLNTTGPTLRITDSSTAKPRRQGMRWRKAA